ncbi:MAG: hypothetical protein JW768_03475 [Chitinispirillaceae bacterium]|nr:hypothetical protein [Chitinispirillaceae bacterium]
MKSPVDTNKNGELHFSWDPMADHTGNPQCKEPLADRRDLNEYFDFLMEVNPSEFVGIKKTESCAEKFSL